MPTIELEARDLLTQRRTILVKGHPHLAGAPDSRWTDYDGTPPPLPEDARLELDEIDAALERLAQGRYGLCQSCGGPIGHQRLRAIPEARFCMACCGARPGAEE